METSVAAPRLNDNSNFTGNHSSKPHQDDHLRWLARLRELVPDPRALHVLIILADLMDENGHVSLHNATLASACGVAPSTFRRYAKKLSKAGELRIITRRVAREFGAPNTYIVKNHAVLRGGL